MYRNTTICFSDVYHPGTYHLYHAQSCSTLDSK